MKVATITALVNALVLALCLKGLHYFHLIKWHPIGFYKNGIGLKKAPNYFNGPFYFLLFIIGLFLYMTMRYVYIIPAVFSSLLLGLLVTITLEWIALDLPLQLTSFKNCRFHLW